MTVEEVRGSLDLTDNGAIKNSIRNCLTVFQNDPVLQGAVRYNILTERIDIVKPLWWSKQTATLTDTDLNYLMLYLEDKYSLTSEKKIQKALSIIADSNKYHPIRDYLNGLEWDGTERIRYALPRFLGAEEGEYTYQALRLFMLGAISRVFKPGCKFEVMLCLVGGQGAGKSTFFRLLAVKDEWFSDDLKKIDDDNVYRKMQGHWIIEMSEMIATANAKSIEDIKSFISRAKETYKVPYETHPADRLRQCVFGGSSNTMDFLPLDRSGNRRFLPIMVHPENAEIHILEDEAASRAFIDMMWAEVMFIYQNFPVKLTLSKDMDKELKELQKQFMPEDTKAGLIQSFLDNFKGTQVCSKLIYAEALNHPFDEPKQWEIREINEIMNNSIEGWRPFSNPRSFMPLIVSEQNIILAYRNICKNNGSKTPRTDGKTITEIQSLPIETVIKTVRNKLNFYQPKKVRRVEIPKDNGKTRPLGIPSIWDRLIQQCILQILEPICEAKFHERNNGFRPYRSTQNAIAQCYKMAQLQNLHFVVDVDIVGFFDNIDHNKLIRQLWGLGIQDRKLIMIIKQMLKAEILFNDIVITPETGTPQGGFYPHFLQM